METINSQINEMMEQNETSADGIEDNNELHLADDIVEKTNERPDFLNDDESDEDDYNVIIGEINTGLPLPYQNKHRTGAVNGNIDLDANPTLKDGTPIYDLDLATLEDKPWRKPGADITDYFNYGFNEELWNQYCERQRKLRQEFGSDQAAINKAILSNIQLTGSAQLGLTTTYSGGSRQLLNILGGGQDSTKQQNVQKIVVDLSKPPPTFGASNTATAVEKTNPMANPIPIIRTVISETGILTRQESSDVLSSYNKLELETGGNNTPIQSPQTKTPPPLNIAANNAPTTTAPQPINIIDFTKPPPSFDPAIPPPLPISSQAQAQPTAAIQQPVPQPSIVQKPTNANVDLPPGMEEEGPPGVSDLPPGIGGISGLPPPIPRIDFSLPPPTAGQFPFNQPTQSSFSSAASSFAPGTGIHSSLQQSSSFSSRQSSLFQPSFRPHFGGGGGGFGGRFHDRYKGGGIRGMFRSDDRSSDSESDSTPTHRKRRRSRSKSRSPSASSRRHKEDKRKDREHKEGKKKKEKEKKEKHKSSHRSPSAKKEKLIKSERRSSEREKEETSHRRSSPKRKEKDDSKNSSSGRITIKIERKSPIE